MKGQLEFFDKKGTRYASCKNQILRRYLGANSRIPSYYTDLSTSHGRQSAGNLCKVFGCSKSNFSLKIRVKSALCKLLECSVIFSSVSTGKWTVTRKVFLKTCQLQLLTMENSHIAFFTSNIDKSV